MIVNVRNIKFYTDVMAGSHDLICKEEINNKFLDVNKNNLQIP